jgi:RNA polymerase sigma-70 factor (ECF subfamily)
MRSGERVDRDHPLLTSALTLLASPGTPESAPACFETGEIALARRDPAAFAPLYERYVDAIHGYCLRRVSDREQAADLTAQIFTRALAAMPQYVESGSGAGSGGTFRSWLFSIAHNLLVDTYRQQREVVSIEQKALGGVLADRAPGPEEHALRDDLRRAFREALAELTDGQREVVELRLAGLTGPEIATVLGMKLAAVKSVQFRAYTRLRELLAPVYGPEDAQP